MSGLVEQFEKGLFQMHAANAEQYIDAVNKKLVEVYPKSKQLTLEPPKNEVGRNK